MWADGHAVHIPPLTRDTESMVHWTNTVIDSDRGNVLWMMTKVPERTRYLGIQRDEWDAVIVALREQGWSVDIGGGLEHSWAVLERDGMRLEMDYDIWREGEIVVAEGDEAVLRACLPIPLLEKLGSP